MAEKIETTDSIIGSEKFMQELEKRQKVANTLVDLIIERCRPMLYSLLYNYVFSIRGAVIRAYPAKAKRVRKPKEPKPPEI